MPNRRQFLGVVGGTLATSLAGCAGLMGTSEQRDDGDSTVTGSGSTAPVGSEGTQTQSENAPERSRYTAVYRELIDSVVLVRSPRGSQGTGFVFEDGTIVTNAHVVGDADRVRVVYDEGVSQVTEVLGTDSLSDLAAIDAADGPSSATALTSVESDPRIGTKVAVIGAPYGLRGSLTSGIVSGINRLIPNPRANFVLPNAIQTDAPVNPGNSGGPLVDLDGRVLGVVNSGRGDNIAFAISAAMVRRVVPALAAEGEYAHPYLGARVTDVTRVVAAANGLDRARGLLVRNVVPGSPAAGTLRGPDSYSVVDGFRVPVGGDILLSIEGEQVQTRQDYLSHLLLRTTPGQSIELDVLREGQRQTVTVTLGRFRGG